MDTALTLAVNNDTHLIQEGSGVRKESLDFHSSSTTGTGNSRRSGSVQEDRVKNLGDSGDKQDNESESEGMEGNRSETDFDADSDAATSEEREDEDEENALPVHFKRFPYMYQLLLPIQLTNPAPTCFQVRVMYNDALRTCEGPLADVQLCFQDLFLRLPVASIFKQWEQSAPMPLSTLPRPSNARLVRLMFDILWEAVQVPGLGLDQIWNAVGERLAYPGDIRRAC